MLKTIDPTMAWKKLAIYFIYGVWVTIVIKILHLISMNPYLLTNLGVIAILSIAIVSHVLVIKNYNLQLDFTPTTKKNLQILLKIFITQLGVFVLSIWLFNNILWQAESNPRMQAISSNLLPSEYSVILINSLINWVILISICLSVMVYKNYSKSNNIRFADMLLSKVTKQPWLFIYNVLLTIESYIRVISFLTLMVILYVNLFEILSNKMNLFSLIKSPISIAMMILLIFVWLKNKLANFVELLCKKQVCNFINMLLLLCFMVGLIIFIVAQIFLQQLEFLQIKYKLPAIGSVLVDLFHDMTMNQQRAKILFYSINIIFTAKVSLDLLINDLSGYKIWMIYLVSLVFPLISMVGCYYWPIIDWLYAVTTTNIVQYLVFILITAIYMINYQNIHHIFCFFGKQQKLDNIDGNPQSIKIKLSTVINKIIEIYFMYLFGYYMFSWVAVNDILLLAAFFMLTMVLLLNIKMLHSKYYASFFQLSSVRELKSIP